MSQQDEPAEVPLDPATERVRRKMVRLLGVSIGIMLIGVMAVLVAVVYRTTETRGPVLAEGEAVPLVLPEGAELLESDLDGDHILLRIAVADGAQELIVLSRLTGATLSRHPVVGP